MTRKIVQSILIVGVIVLISTLAIVLGVTYNYFAKEQISQLKTELELASVGVENEGIKYLEDLNIDNIRFTLIEQDGTVVYDSKADASTMENHSNREEIQEANAYGSGQSARYSATLTKKTVYVANKLGDNTILRVAIDYATLTSLFLNLLKPTILICIIAVGIAILLAVKLSKNIVEPLNSLDLNKPLENNIYPELSPLLRHIQNQKDEIQNQIEEIVSTKREFDDIVQNMNEGLVLLNENRDILSINQSAKQLYNIDTECINQNFLTIERDYKINNALNEAIQKNSNHIRITKNNKQYELHINTIYRNNKLAGIVLLSIDITDKAISEIQRREFTANVSHEFKTPLQTIMGSAELLETGLVKNDDIPKFVNNIRLESSRLLDLINDVIGLSKLDEQQTMETENVNIYEVANAVVNSLQQTAKIKSIKLDLTGDKATINTIKALVQDIILNLCENAIKYTNNNGEVNVVVEEDNSNVYIIVEDNGIGIPEEEQSRVFERFYRVDKSHSRDTGGTGLGLSIVKNAVQHLNGNVTLTSEIHKGTNVTVILKK